MHIVLHQPEIPGNTGNIGRTCVATGTSLHLIEPLGFQLNEKMLKRAGMDYWAQLDVRRYMNFEEFIRLHPELADAPCKQPDAAPHPVSPEHTRPRLWFATTKAHQCYTEVSFGSDDYIMFGKESAGIPEELLVAHEESCIRIPMLDTIRSLNLANSVAIVLYEALHQNGFTGMREYGELHRLRWGS